MLANALSLALVAGAAMAAPCNSPNTTSSIAPGDKFGLLALRSASPIHFGQVGAALGSIFLNLGQQNATCATDDASPDYATFTLSADGALYLYAEDAGADEEQQLFADRSGMGQGKFGYTTGPGAPRNSERTTFALDQYDDMTLNGVGFLACPNSINGAWSVWVDAGIANPAGNEGCLGFVARAVKLEDAVSCIYS